MTDALVLTAKAWESLTAAGKAALPREVGGLLLGHFDKEGPRVTDAVVVPDPRATRIRYRRDAAAAARILDGRIDSDATGLLGYLGEWHTHPLPLGPSGRDEYSILRLAEDGGHDVTLLVLALGTHGWTLHARQGTPAGTVHNIRARAEGRLT